MRKKIWINLLTIAGLILTAGCCRLLEHQAGSGMRQDPTAGNVLDMEFVHIKAGSFEMGSNEGNPDEQPVRTVHISQDFRIGKYPVTQRQYRNLTGRNPSRFKGDDRPVEKVRGRGAESFCRQLTQRERAAGRLPEGLVYRLPTEAEWEYAARGGHLATETLYSGSDDIDAVAWHKGNSGGTTHPVGLKAPNELGLYDMSGNVPEWCHDLYQNSYKGLSETDPAGPHAGNSYTVLRGGGFSCDAFSCRVTARDGYTSGNNPYSLGFRVVLGPPVRTEECGSMEFKRAFQHSTPTLTKTLPYTLPWDDMPIDLSFVYADEKPAGKRGFLTVQGDRFVFEDGTEARFWGTNFNAAQNFPSHEHSEKLARRLAKIGVNLVRLHQLDSSWSTPNIFQYSRGEYKPDTMSFDPESLDRLDYLIYCMKKEGIYVYMDLLVHRQFTKADGVPSATKLGIAAKPYSTFNRRMIDLQKKYNYDLWTHVNPYTGLAYKDEPAIVLTGIANENDLWSRVATLEPYRTELEELYRKWAAENGKIIPDGKVDFSLIDRTMNEFFIFINQNYYTEMIEHMRETGVRIPINGTNWSRGAGHLYAQRVTDFTDAHDYWRRGGGRTASGRRDANGFFGNLPMTPSFDNMLPVPSFNRMQGKPFFISEWDNSYPNEWRAESSLLLAAAGSFQSWDGFAIHTYRYTKDENVDMIGKPVTSGALGGTAFRGGSFDTFNDPAKFGLFYHAALIFRRGDVRPAEKTVSVVLDDLYLPAFWRGSAGLEDRSLIPNNQDMATADGLAAFQLTIERHRMETVLPGMTPSGSIFAKPDQQIVDISRREVLSDTSELYRNLNDAFGWIDSPRTKAVYGFVGKEDAFDLSDVKIDVKTDFATVAISSLTDDPVRRSSNMLLTTVGRADNTNAKYNENRTQQLDPGHGPILVEIIEAKIEIETDKKNLIVMSINPQGMVIGYVPARYEAGVFSFEVGRRHPSMYYLIQEL